MRDAKVISAFLELVKAGLWEYDVQLSSYECIDFKAVYQLAQEQTVVGLIAAGLEHVSDKKISQIDVLKFIDDVLHLERRNSAMNAFVAEIMNRLQEMGVYTLLVKGQGVAQCYERPLWRTCGDVDLFFDSNNYNKAALFLPSIASRIGENMLDIMHFGMTIGQWEVELHGTMRTQLGKRIDRTIDDVQKDTFEMRNIRIWNNKGVDIPLPAADNDVMFVFTHLIEHFFGNGVGLRQICDWCRLIWTYRNDLDVVLLEKRLRNAGLMTEWKAFASLAVNNLGMPKEAMPLYVDSNRWQRKAERILNIILDTGNMGHNKDMSYQQRHSVPVYKLISFCRNTWDSMRHCVIFPKDAARVWVMRTREGFSSLGHV